MIDSLRTQLLAFLPLVVGPAVLCAPIAFTASNIRTMALRLNTYD